MCNTYFISCAPLFKIQTLFNWLFSGVPVIFFYVHPNEIKQNCSMYKIMKFYPNMSLKNHISVNIWRAIFFTYAVNTKYVRLKIDLESKNK